jgi:hypothetical protein
MKQIRARLGWICLLCSFTLTACRDARTDPEAVKQRMAAALPLGSTPAQVLTYLNEQKIDHYQDAPGATADKSIVARIRNQQGWSIVETSYIVRFSFDDEGHLNRVDARRVYTGP